MAKKSVKRKRIVNITKQNKTLRQSKQMLTPLEYLKQSNTAIFGNDMLNNGNVRSISIEKFRKNNLTKLNFSSAGLKAFDYSEPIHALLNKDVLNYEEDQHIIDAMLKIDYKCYLSDDSINYKTNLNAEILKTLKDNLIPGASVLNVGSGSGDLSVIFANMVNVRGLKGDCAKGCVNSIEINKDTLNKSYNNISKDLVNKDLLEENNFKIIEDNGKYGFPSKSNDQLYDVIHVSIATNRDYAPKYLKAQLKEKGIMFIPIINDGQQIVRIYQRIDGKIKYLNSDSDFNVNYNYFLNA